MAITNARMQMRRGLEADFDPDKMQPGEWAVSLDKKYVRMCFSPGVCVRMATYEAFEEDMEQIIAILEEAKTVQEAIEKIYEEFQKAELDIEAAENSAILSESYAHGGTGTRDGEDTDNAKYYAEKAKESAESFEFPVSIKNGGTGGTTAKEAQYNLLKDMNEVTETLGDETRVMFHYGSPSPSSGSAYYRKAIHVWNYIKSKAEAIFAKKEDVALNRQTLGYTKKNLLKLVDGTASDSEVNIVSNASAGTVTFKSITTATTGKFMTVCQKKYLKAGRYIVTGCPSGGIDYDANKTLYRQTIFLRNADGTYLSEVNDFGDGEAFIITKEQEDAGAYIACIVYIFAGYYADNLTFYPMIRSADIVDDTFEPYVDDVDTRLNALTPVNNFLTTVPGSPLDAVMGKELNDRLATVEDAFVFYTVELINGWAGELVVSINKINRQATITGYIDGTNATSTVFAKGRISATQAFTERRMPVPIQLTALMAVDNFGTTFQRVSFTTGDDGMEVKVPSTGSLYQFNTALVAGGA